MLLCFRCFWNQEKTSVMNQKIKNKKSATSQFEFIYSAGGGESMSHNCDSLWGMSWQKWYATMINNPKSLCTQPTPRAGNNMDVSKQRQSSVISLPATQRCTTWGSHFLQNVIFRKKAWMQQLFPRASVITQTFL